MSTRQHVQTSAMEIGTPRQLQPMQLQPMPPSARRGNAGPWKCLICATEEIDQQFGNCPSCQSARGAVPNIEQVMEKLQNAQDRTSAAESMHRRLKKRLADAKEERQVLTTELATATARAEAAEVSGGALAPNTVAEPAAATGGGGGGDMFSEANLPSSKATQPSDQLNYNRKVFDSALTSMVDDLKSVCEVTVAFWFASATSPPARGR